VAEPVNRPERIHEYELTSFSLYAAALTGQVTDKIVSRLEMMCKTALPASVAKMIRNSTASWGQVAVTARQNKYFIESSNPVVLQKLVQDEEIQAARAKPEGGGDALALTAGVQAATREAVNIAGIGKGRAGGGGAAKELTDAELLAAMEDAEKSKEVPEDLYAMAKGIEAEDDDEEEITESMSFEIAKGKLEPVQRRCFDLGYPLHNEYDFRNDAECPTVNMSLKSTTVLRPYQEKALRRMFSKGRAGSGMIVLPCGAGKTLTGVAAACTVKKRVLILCTSTLAVDQWKNEFGRWSTVDPKYICRFTSSTKDKIAAGPVCPLPPHGCGTKQRGRERCCGVRAVLACSLAARHTHTHTHTLTGRGWW